MTKKQKKKIKNNIVNILILTIIFYFLFSYAEVLNKNLTAHPTYSAWNIFEIFK